MAQYVSVSFATAMLLVAGLTVVNRAGLARP
jgi:hypothetical protein